MEQKVANIAAFVLARLDEDEQAARAANRPYRFADEGSTAPASGVHWQWVTGDNWEPVQPNPTLMEFVEGADGSWAANLATVEKWPSSIRIDDERGDTRLMPQTYAGTIEEMDPAAAVHIARHDPARVLAQVAALRAVVDTLTGRERTDDSEEGLWHKIGYDRATFDVLRLLARIWKDHPDYDPAWSE